MLDGGVPVAQLFGPVGPGQAQDVLVTLGLDLVEPAQGPAGTAELGQAEAVGLPQTHTLAAIALGHPLFHLGRPRRVLGDPGQAQLEQGIVVFAAVAQRFGGLHGIAVAPLFGQGLHQQGARLFVGRHAFEQMPGQAFDFFPVLLLCFAVAAVHVGVAAKAFEIAEVVGQQCAAAQGQHQAANEQAANVQGSALVHATSRAMR
ncbi:hypothetical protein D3C85_1041510 [compost metagenome]